MKRRDKAGEVREQGFEGLDCWQLARRLMIACHETAGRFPACEKYDLTSQIRRSSKSTTANIAEGYGRYHYADSLRFYYIARGSLNETVNHIITAHDLGYIADDRYRELYDLGRRVERALNGYIGYVRRRKSGHEMYGDKYVPDPDQTPQSPKP